MMRPKLCTNLRQMPDDLLVPARPLISSFYAGSSVGSVGSNRGQPPKFGTFATLSDGFARVGVKRARKASCFVKARCTLTRLEAPQFECADPASLCCID